jgi:hypothetical protein
MDISAQALHDPETGAPFIVNDAQRVFLALAFELTEDGRLKYPELVFAAPKKSGKTAFGALISLIMVLLLGGKFAEGYVVVNDLEQAQGRVVTAARRIVEASPLLAGSAICTGSRIEFPELKATITAIASDAAGAAGANPVVSTFDEIWGVTSERGRRLFDEMVPPPTRKIACRLTVTYAGFEGESELLEELYRRGLKQPLVGDSLYAGEGMLMAWHHRPIAPWQTPEWLEQMRQQLRPNAYLRLIENRFVSSESTFVDVRSLRDPGGAGDGRQEPPGLDRHRRQRQARQHRRGRRNDDRQPRARGRASHIPALARSAARLRGDHTAQRP